MFFQKDRDPFYTKLAKVLSRQNNVKKIKKAFYIGGFAFRKEAMEDIKKAILENQLDSFLKNAKYDTLQDNIEIYWVKDKSGYSFIIIILDPIELYQKEEILSIISFNKEAPNTFSLKQIYPITSNP